jgi:hypothetical protein
LSKEIEELPARGRAEAPGAIRSTEKAAHCCIELLEEFDLLGNFEGSGRPFLAFKVKNSYGAYLAC